MNWLTIKQILRKNLFTLLNLFAQEDDFINGDKRRKIHAANQRQVNSTTNKSPKDF